MRKFVIFSLSIFLWSMIYVGAVSAVSAASLSFDKTTYTGAVGSTISVNVLVDPGTDSISSTDAHVTYDSTVLQAVSVTAGTYFPSVDETITAGKVSIYASISSDSLTAKTGKGTIATVVFNVLKNGSSNVTFFCDSNSYNTSKIIKDDTNATNIITCASNGSAVVTAGTGGSSSTLTTPTPVTALPVTGVVEDLSMISILGFALIAIGGIIKLRLRS